MRLPWIAWKKIITEEINKTILSSDGDKWKQWIDSTETYACETTNGLVCRKAEINCNNIIKQYRNV